MDPTRPPHSPTDRTQAAHAARPGGSVMSPISGVGPLHQQPLPPIRHLHPDLPLRATMHTPHAQSTSAYEHPHAGGYAAPVALGSNPTSMRPPADDSDADGDSQEPPKKKRRRQALSCTECKRRKIKCDRAQPCGPCVRRGEHSKCQWHIIEPMEKYVTRAEYDELKARVSELEALVHRLSVGSPTTLPTRSGVSPPSVSLVPGPHYDQGTAITPYQQSPHPSGPAPYHGMQHAAHSVGRFEPSGAYTHTSRLVAPRSPTSPTHPPSSHGLAGRSGPAIMSPTEPHRPPMYMLSSSSIPPPSNAGSSGTATSRRASLSLAAITNPSTPEAEHRPPSSPKKAHAQTLALSGQRLRTESHTDPAQVVRTQHPPRPPRPNVGRQQPLQIQA
ncbi:hypothetical protein WOLCODRAFT_142321 [Wolfiporia cocos MD-104 SS10]|uniref:Zn(2)-C6 fungal-type domain-containing protein n=1 Tax=Wolfiporia cocos (strain MD-104) TaxID=742152 RepID=A0A2H3JGP0_WOLCO|nr:hypothetical protein WOLCODRAFT_142321 [Wolfiporia cocos MD-104 SS10]